MKSYGLPVILLVFLLVSNKNIGNIDIAEGNIGAMGSYNTSLASFFSFKKETVSKEKEADLGWLLWPSNTRVVTDTFGTDRIDHYHSGIDLSGNVEGVVTAAVLSSRGGIVKTGKTPKGVGYGKHIIIYHDPGFSTLYAHLKKFEVKDGDTVIAGQLIGFSGETGRSRGIHLHFEVRFLENNKWVRVNPLDYFSKNIVSDIAYNLPKKRERRYRQEPEEAVDDIQLACENRKVKVRQIFDSTPLGQIAAELNFRKSDPEPLEPETGKPPQDVVVGY